MALVKFKKSGAKKFGYRDVRMVEAGDEYELDDSMLSRYGDSVDIVGRGKKKTERPNSKKGTAQKG